MRLSGRLVLILLLIALVVIAGLIYSNRDPGLNVRANETSGIEGAQDATERLEDATASPPCDEVIPSDPPSLPTSEEIDPAPPLSSEAADISRIVVRCFDSGSMAPIEDFTVSLASAGSAGAVLRSREGECLVPAECSSARVLARGYRGADIKPAEATEGEMRCELERLFGQGIVLREGEPAGDCVVVQYHGGTTETLDLTGDDGRFYFAVISSSQSELRAGEGDWIGSISCAPGEAHATIHLLPSASLLVLADGPLPPLRVEIEQGRTLKHAGGESEARLTGLDAYARVMIYSDSGTLLGTTVLGPPGTERILPVTLNVPDVWVVLQDSDGAPIAWTNGMTVKVGEGGTATLPKIEAGPLRVFLPICELTFAGRRRAIEVRRQDGSLAYSGWLSSAWRDGGQWKVDLRPARTWSGTVVHEGRPVAGARVRAGLPGVPDETLTDEGGRFQVAATSDRAAVVYAHWRGMAGYTDAPPGRGIVIELREARTLTIQVPGAQSVSASWNGNGGPMMDWVAALGEEVVLQTPAIDGNVTVRANSISIEQDVAASESNLRIELPQAVEIEVKATEQGVPAPGVRVYGASSSREPRRVYRFRVTTGPNGVARVMLPQHGRWSIGSSHGGGGNLDTRRQTSVTVAAWVSRSRFVEVFGTMNWQPDSKNPVALFQTDRQMSGPFTYSDRSELGDMKLERIGNFDIATHSYRASMPPDLPYVLVRVGNNTLIPAGMLRETKHGWRCDLQLDQ